MNDLDYIRKIAIEGINYERKAIENKEATLNKKINSTKNASDVLKLIIENYSDSLNLRSKFIEIISIILDERYFKSFEMSANKDNIKVYNELYYLEFSTTDFEVKVGRFNKVVKPVEPTFSLSLHKEEFYSDWKKLDKEVYELLDSNRFTKDKYKLLLSYSDAIGDYHAKKRISYINKLLFMLNKKYKLKEITSFVNEIEKNIKAYCESLNMFQLELISYRLEMIHQQEFFNSISDIVDIFEKSNWKISYHKIDKNKSDYFGFIEALENEIESKIKKIHNLEASEHISKYNIN